MSPRAASLPPEIPGFRPLGLLGRGGFADVFAYEQLGLGRTVAVKVLLHGITADSQSAFEAEANVMARLSNHPSIVSIYQAGAAADGRPFLVMEFCPPPHLSARVKRRPLAVPTVLEVGVQIAGAAETAHRIGVLHRDIKPANILFTEFGRPALTDFGIAATTLAAETGAAAGMSVAWAPPEQLAGDHPMDASGDVYSLAATLWAALAGHSPFERPGATAGAWELSQRVKNDPLPPLPRDDVPEELERTLRTALAKSPARRYPTAVEFARALQRVQAGLRLPVTPVEVRDEQAVGEWHVDGEGGTRVTGFVVIDPGAVAGPPTGSVTDPATGPSTGSGVTAPTDLSGPGEDLLGWGVRRERSAHDTVVRGRAVDPGAAGTAPAARERAPRSAVGSPWVRRSLAGVALAVGVVGAVVLIPRLADVGPQPDRPTADPTRSADPQDPVGEVVPSPDRLRVRVTRGGAMVVWHNPDPHDGDSFLVQVQDVPAPPPLRVQGTRALVDPTPGRTCVEVSLVRATGRASTEPARACSAG